MIDMSVLNGKHIVDFYSIVRNKPAYSDICESITMMFFTDDNKIFRLDLKCEL
jgi:hypothetical protein